MTGLLLLLCFVGAVGCIAFFVIDSFKEKSLTSGLSGPAAAIVTEYNELPPESRPFPDVKSIVQALDKKFAVDALERKHHFDANWLPNIKSQNGSYYFTWSPSRQSCRHQSHTCKFHEYADLHRAIQDVHNALQERERQIAASVNAPASDMLNELTQALRQEAEIHRQITKDHL